MAIPITKTLVLCFDGTSNEYSANNTNVVKFFSLLKKDDFSQQLCYYQPGVGTYFAPGLISPFFQWLAKVADLAVAWYLDAHVMGGYQFVQENYRVGDKICIFGFSRGAYTARALAGMLYKVGLLPKDNIEQIPFAYKLYKRTDPEGDVLSAGFKQTYSQDVKIEFLGVWDTVASVGIVAGRTLPFTESNTAIKTFRHALSLDEHRAKFRPNLYHRTSPTQVVTVLDPAHASHSTEPSVSSLTRASDSLVGLFSSKHSKGKKSGDASDGDPDPEENPGGVSQEGAIETDLLEVWFSGCHSDVGGGELSNVANLSLSQIPFCWMVRQVITADCGIQFDPTAFPRNGLPELSTFAGTSPTKASAQELALDTKNALQPLHDALKITPIWWILEIVPLHFSWQDSKDVWHTEYGLHLGKGRDIAQEGRPPYFHVSVKQRMDAPALGYRPKAIWTPGSETYLE